MAIKKDGSVIIDTQIDTKGFNKGVGNMQKSISGLSGTISKLGVAIGIAFSARAVINFGKECIDLGSDLQEVQNVVDVTFGDMSGKIDEFARNAIEQFGLSELAAKQYASTMGAMLKSMGFNQADVLEMSTTLAGLAGDIASFYNLTGDEAFTKIRAGISGETEPLKQLGINLSVANLEAFALAQGITKSYNAMTEHEKAMLRYNYLLKTTADAQGDFARTSDSWANQTRILAEQFNSLKATIGQGLINAFTPVIKVLNVIIAKLQDVANVFKALTEYLFGNQETKKIEKNLSGIEDGYVNIEDAADAANKAQKGNLSTLEELNVLSVPSAETATSSGAVIDTENTADANKELEDTKGIIDEIIEKHPRLIAFLDDVSAKIKEIIQDIKFGDFEELGGDISDLAVIIFDFISDSIAEVDWEDIGNKIGEFLKGVDWLEVIKSGLKLKFNIWQAIAEVWFGAYEVAPIETAMLTALGLVKFTGLGNLWAGKIKTALTTSLLTSLKSLGGIKGLLTTDLSTILGAGTASEIGLTIGSGIIAGIAAAILGFGFGKWLGEKLNPDDAEFYRNFKWFGEEGFFSTVFGDLGTSFDALVEMATDFSNNPIIAGLTNVLAGPIGAAVFQIEGHKEEIENFLDQIQQKTVKFGERVGKWYKNDVSPWFTKEKWTELWRNVKTVFEKKWNEIETWWKNNAISKWWNEDVKPWFTKEKWVEVMKGIKDALPEVFKEAVNDAITIFNKFIDFINEKMSFKWDGLSIAGKEIFPSGNTKLFEIPNIPYLATGAVIPPNAPFMAMLGDQRNGRNLEAPEGLIRQIIREELANINVNVEFDVKGDPNGIFKVTRRKAREFTKRTGTPAYEF